MNAQKVYSKVQKETLSGRDIEVQVLRKASAQFQQALDIADQVERGKRIDGAVRYQLRVWDVFHADWERADCPLAPKLRADLLSLSLYVHKTSLEVLAYGDARKIKSLVAINDCLAAGLAQGATVAPQPAVADAVA